MANQVAANPMELDTVGTILTSKIAIVAVEWASPVSQGDDMVLSDVNGNQIVAAVCEAAGQSQFRRFEPAWYDGLVLTTLDSGTVFVHFR